MHRAVAITALAALMVVSLASPIVQASRPEGDLQVTVTYSGKGKVDDTHEIWIYLFDTPTPSPDVMPLAMDSITTNGGAKEFKGLKGRVYVFVAYDESGDYQGNSAPPPGMPVGTYSTDGKGPSPVEPGPGVKVNVTFDDSQRMTQ